MILLYMFLFLYLCLKQLTKNNNSNSTLVQHNHISQISNEFKINKVNF